MSAETIAAAVGLAAEGKAVFFCGGDKRPTTPHGFHNATTNLAAVHELHRLYPGPLIGVATGQASGFDALDLDTQHGDAAAWWNTNRRRLPTTRVHRTRSGGLHLLFRHTAGVRNSASKIARGVDTRGDGGYVIWWPSAGLPVLCDVSLAPWPQALLDKLIPMQPAHKPQGTIAGRIPNDCALGRLVRLVAGAAEGKRNDVAYWAACRAGEMARAGLIAPSAAAAIIAEAAVRAGLERDEAERTAWSGVQTGQGGPHA